MDDDVIVTDMGHVELDCQQAQAYFSKETICAWWLAVSDEWELNYLFSELGLQINPDDEDAVQDFFDQYDGLPRTVHFTVARAVYKDQKWVRILPLETHSYPLNVAQSERASIELGIALRTHLGINAVVVNDSKDIVKLLKPDYPFLKWQSRKRTKIAHRLSIDQATKVISPETEL